MSVSLGANGNSYSYPQTDDTLWGDDATNWASAVSAALGAIGLGSTVNTKAVIDMISTTKGFLPPRQTTTQRDAISSPPSALIIYNTTTSEINLYTGSAWYGIPVRDTLTTNRIVQWDGAKLIDSPLTASGSDLTIAGNFTAQIGTFNTRVISAVFRAASSAGISLQNNTGTEVLLLGAGGGTGATFAGGVNITGNAAVGDGTVGTPGLHFVSDTDNGFYRIGTNQVGISAAGARVGEFGSGYGGFIGNVIQVQSAIKTDSFSSTPSAGNYTDVTGLAVTITPKYSNSKILIICSITGASANQCYLRIDRNGTPISIGDASGSELRVSFSDLLNDGSGFNLKGTTMNFLDSPASVSAQTYQIQGTAGGTIYYINRSTASGGTNGYARGVSNITALEIMQ